MMILLLGFVLGMATGLRSMTPAAVLAWAAQVRWPHLGQTGFAFMAAPISAYILTLGACVELVFDKLPITPSRLTPGPLGARVVLGGLCAATLSAAVQQSAIAGAVVGALGGFAGAWAGYYVRRHLTTTRKAPDILVALIEDAIAIGSAVFVVSRF
jgi:uncharacterized membrane protein